MGGSAICLKWIAGTNEWVQSSAQKQTSWLNLEEEESEPHGSGKDDAHSSAEQERAYDEDTKESEDKYISKYSNFAEETMAFLTSLLSVK